MSCKIKDNLEAEKANDSQEFTMDSLAGKIVMLHDTLQAEAAHAINLMLTTRNWLIGCYIVEYEQNGKDRAQYGEELLKSLAKKVSIKGLGWRRLYEFRQFYMAYPYLAKDIFCYLKGLCPDKILRLPTAILQITDSQHDTNVLVATCHDEEQILKWQTPADKLFNRLSATHLIMISAIKDPLKRAFYEQESILPFHHRFESRSLQA